MDSSDPLPLLVLKSFPLLQVEFKSVVGPQAMTRPILTGFPSLPFLMNEFLRVPGAEKGLIVKGLIYTLGGLV